MDGKTGPEAGQRGMDGGEPSIPRPAGRESPNFRQLAFMASIFFLMSFWLHFPGMSPNNYSDLMDTLWSRIHASTGIVPYADYALEYPAISALALYVSSAWGDMYAFYVSMSLILFACMLVTVYLLCRILSATGQSGERIGYFMVFTPSFIYYSIYSFDWIGAVLMVASIYFAHARKVRLSGAFMGLAVAARIIPVVCLPILLLQFKRLRSRGILLLTAAGAWLVVNLYFIITNFQGFLYPYVFQAGYNVEDSWLGILSTFAKPASIVLFASLLGLVLLWRKRFTLFQQCLLSVLAFVLTSYKFPPQYMILLLPLFALTAANYGEFMIANSLSVVLILFYFTSMFNFGAGLALSSPVQWVAVARQAALAVVFVRLFVSVRKKKERGEAAQADRKVELQPKIAYGDTLQDVPA